MSFPTLASSGASLRSMMLVTRSWCLRHGLCWCWRFQHMCSTRKWWWKGGRCWKEQTQNSRDEKQKVQLYEFNNISFLGFPSFWKKMRVWSFLNHLGKKHKKLYVFFLLNMSMDSMAIALKKGNPSPAILRSCYEGLRASRVTSVASFQIEEISKLR